MDDPRPEIISAISAEKSRIVLAPHIAFICGGEVDVEQTNNHSVRNMFMNISASIAGEHINFVLAETYKDWKDAYRSLSDFENDIAHISSKVVVIPETAGSITELGLFFGNKLIRRKMTVVLNELHHNSESFIKYGILAPLEEHYQNSVLAYDLNYEDIENISPGEVTEAVRDVVEACQILDKSEAFELENRGHEIFLIFQIVDLFHALTITEIKEFASSVLGPRTKLQITSALYILEKFDLVYKKEEGKQISICPFRISQFG